MADIELNVDGSYRSVEYTVSLIESILGREQWTFRVNVYALKGWVACKYLFLTWVLLH
jgi:hypothetical protein